jgi:hypothetical protein
VSAHHIRPLLCLLDLTVTVTIKEIPMSNNHLITQLVIANLITLITATTAFANTPTQLNITCQSKQIGKIEINLSEANAFGGKEEFYYKITTNRYDRQSGKYLGSETHKIDVHSKRRYCTFIDK